MMVLFSEEGRFNLIADSEKFAACATLIGLTSRLILDQSFQVIKNRLPLLT
jgi:hypothetical protein